VQSHRRLTRTRAALNHQNPRPISSNNPILLSLDSGHNIAHTTRAGLIKRRHQSTLTLKRHVTSRRSIHHQQLIFNPANRAAPGGYMTTSSQPQRLTCGSLIKSPRRRGTPIQQHLTALIIMQTHASHIVTRTVTVIHTPKN